MGATEHFAVLPPMSDCISQVHVWNRKHCGIREAWKRLNEMFLVHRIPYRLVIELSTPVSQKVLHGLLAMDP